MKCFPKMGHAWSFTQERESQSIQTHVKTQQNWSEQTSWQTDTEPERLQQLNNKNKKCGQVEIITSTHPESPFELFSNRSSDFSPHCRPHCITWHSLVPLYIQHTWVRFTNITKKNYFSDITLSHLSQNSSSHFLFLVCIQQEEADISSSQQLVFVMRRRHAALLRQTSCFWFLDSSLSNTSEDPLLCKELFFLRRSVRPSEWVTQISLGAATIRAAWVLLGNFWVHASHSLGLRTSCHGNLT